MSTRDIELVREMLEQIAETLEHAPADARQHAASGVDESRAAYEVGFLVARASSAAMGIRIIVKNLLPKDVPTT